MFSNFSNTQKLFTRDYSDGPRFWIWKALSNKVFFVLKFLPFWMFFSMYNCCVLYISHSYFCSPNPNSEADPVHHYSRSTILYKDYPTEDISIYITIWPLNISYNFILAQEIQVLKIWNQKCLSLKEHRYSTACPKWTGMDLVAILWKNFS